MTMQLRDLNFVDLYLGTDYAELKGLEGSKNLTDPAPQELTAPIEVLRKNCRFIVSSEKDPEFSIAFEGIMYRGTMMRDVTGGSVFTLRRSTAQVRPLEKVGLAPALTRQLLDPSLKGLVLIAGETGAGKTSTAVAILKARMERIGGIAVAIEDPPEVDLNGTLGKGRCMQIRASRRTGGYREHLVRSLRTNPDMIFLGEVREEMAAREVVEASLNGHLIISTIHAGGVTETIERLASIASANGDQENAFRKLASGLRMVIWQSLERDANGGASKFNYEALSLIGDNASGARTKIHTGRISHLIQDIDQQMRVLNLNPMGHKR